MGLFAYIKNGVKYKMNQFPGAYPASRVSYNGSNVETALDEINADIIKCEHKTITTGALSGNVTANIVVPLPADYNEIVDIIPNAVNPASTWNTVAHISSVNVSTATISVRPVGTDNQAYTIAYCVLYK